MLIIGPYTSACGWCGEDSSLYQEGKEEETTTWKQINKISLFSLNSRLVFRLYSSCFQIHFKNLITIQLKTDSDLDNIILVSSLYAFIMCCVHGPILTCKCLHVRVCIHVRVCVHVCACVHMCIHICACMYVCAYVHTQMHVCVYIDACVCVHVHIYAYIDAHASVRMCVCMCASACV